VLALLLVHDYLLAKGGIALPSSHGLRAAIERHKARLTSEFTRARIRRKQPSTEAFQAAINEEFKPEEAGYPRWVRINSLKTTVEDQLETTLAPFQRVLSLEELLASKKCVYIDEHIPNLVAVSPGTDLTKTAAYVSGALILQDKASCFPAYLLDPQAEDGDVVDACAAPGNKTTHLAAIMEDHKSEVGGQESKIFAFEKNSDRAITLSKMVERAGSRKMTRIGLGKDFLKAKPDDPAYQNVGALLLDPSCSGSGIVGRDSAPPLHLPVAMESSNKRADKAKPDQPKVDQPKDNGSRKRKRELSKQEGEFTIDDDGNIEISSSEQDFDSRLRALSSFQLSLLLHAFSFPAATKITYSTCSIHAEENEQVVLKALQSDIARKQGWHILPRDKQVRGMKDWQVRGSVEAANGDADIADACIRAYKDDGRGVMGFFVVAFARQISDNVDAGNGPYVRNEEGTIVRDVLGMPMLKSTGAFVSIGAGENESGEQEKEADETANSDSDASPDDSTDDESGLGPEGKAASSRH
jgi:putative methyltransferase